MCIHRTDTSLSFSELPQSICCKLAKWYISTKCQVIDLQLQLLFIILWLVNYWKVILLCNLDYWIRSDISKLFLWTLLQIICFLFHFVSYFSVLYAYVPSIYHVCAWIWGYSLHYIIIILLGLLPYFSPLLKSLRYPMILSTSKWLNKI